VPDSGSAKRTDMPIRAHAVKVLIRTADVRDLHALEDVAAVVSRGDRQRARVAITGTDHHMRGRWLAAHSMQLKLDVTVERLRRSLRDGWRHGPDRRRAQGNWRSRRR
jgi:hypothetical protein